MKPPGLATLACEMVPSSHREWEDVAHEGGKGGRTFAPVDALAVQEDPPSPAARLGPIHWMGRAVRSQAHALSGHTMQALRPLKLSCDACAHARMVDLELKGVLIQRFQNFNRE